MDQHKTAADRIRPILQTMDRTIDALRRTRTHVAPAPIAAPAGPAAALIPRTAAPSVIRPATPPAAPTSTRLKARPKRIDSPYLGTFGQDHYRSQAS
jgi:hypothetical protein